MKKYIVEFIGTFFLVLTIGMCVVKSDLANFAPIAIGSALMVMIYASGHISGAHFNPAVTLALTVRGRCKLSDIPGYIIAQCLAAFIGATLVLFLKNAPEMAEPKALPVVAALIAEFLGTFALAYVILNVATSKNTAGNSYYGLAIGFTVLAMAYVFGAISGGAFNPAVALGITVMHLTKVADLWIFLLANFAGGTAAGLTFRFLNPEDK